MVWQQLHLKWFRASLLITILVAFLEAAAQKLSPQAPPFVMGFAGIVAPLQQTDDHH